MIARMVLPEVEELKKYTFDLGPIRPPSEGGSASLLIRATVNCPWNFCTFCASYKGKRFVYRSVDEVKRDIDSAKAIADLLTTLSNKLGGMDWVARIIDPLFLYGKSFEELSADEMRNYENIALVYRWLEAGARTVFLQDANTPIMRTNELVEILQHIKRCFPTVVRITSYARAKTLAHKPLDDLIKIRQAGLTRLHVGLESGDDEVLAYIKKGVTSEEQIEAGYRSKKAGFELSEYWMPGVGGRRFWLQHAKNTARVLNLINPDYIRSRPFTPRIGTPLYEVYLRGEFELTTPHERLQELKLMISELNVTSRVCFDHFMNSWRRADGSFLFKQDYEGYKFPEEKALVLELIEEGLRLDESIHISAETLAKMPYI
ncbi:MAG: radical SAM protein [Nitrososphaerales archaeon]